MRATLGVRLGPLSLRTGNLLPHKHRRRGRRRSGGVGGEIAEILRVSGIALWYVLLFEYYILKYVAIGAWRVILWAVVGVSRWREHRRARATAAAKSPTDASW